jgi:hypothetical protein
MLSLILTYLNLVGGFLTGIVILITMYRYIISYHIAKYMVLLLFTVSMLIFIQTYQLATESVPEEWKFKMLGLYLWLKSLYFCHVIRFTSLKK